MSIATLNRSYDERIARRWGVSLEDYRFRREHGWIWCPQHRGWIRRSDAACLLSPNTGICRECRGKK